MPKIIRLSPQMANLIAAGEVVERPGSVAKELVENAIDAGATRITVEVRNGGVTYLRVADNGCGIPRDEVRTAFLRFATSKIRSETDLLAIGTLGFRGEALAATAAVSKVEVLTKTQDAEEGTRMVLEAGEELEFAEAGCPAGTTIMIRDLFFNVPARMKFLKKDNTESSYVEAAVTAAALSRPDIAFTMIRDGRETLHTNGDGKLRSVIYAMAGRELASQMIATVGAFGEITLDGFVSPPSVSRSGRGMQYFFINGRPVRSKILYAAVDEAYKGRLMNGRMPACFLNLHLSLGAVDVNVHPAKLEVKFTREKEVFTAVYNAVRSALDANDDISSLRQDKPAAPAVPKEEGTSLAQQVLDKPPARPLYTFPESHSATVKPVADVSRPVYHTRPVYETTSPPRSGAKAIEITPTPEEEALMEARPAPPDAQRAIPAAKPAEPSKPVQANTPPAESGPVKVIGEVFSTYIIAEEGDTLWLIDKHAAHERMIFNQLKANCQDQHAQLLLEPVTVTLSKEQKEACLDRIDELNKAGFQVEDFGMNSLMVRQSPLYLDAADIPFVLSDIADKLALQRPVQNELLDELLKSVSCKAAIKAGSRTSAMELQDLVRRIMDMPDVRQCPHGRPVAVGMSRRELEKQFKRVL